MKKKRMTKLSRKYLRSNHCSINGARKLTSANRHRPGHKGKK